MTRRMGSVKKSLIVFMTAVFMVVMCVSVHALTVTRYAQEKTYWCWAACGEMVFNYIDSSFTKGTFSSRQQRIVSAAGKDPSKNETGSVVHIITAGKSIVPNQFVNASYPTLDDNSFSAVTSLLSSKPVVVSVYLSDNGGGHSLVAYKYTSSTQEISMHDPWVGASTITANKTKQN